MKKKIFFLVSVLTGLTACSSDSQSPFSKIQSNNQYEIVQEQVATRCPTCNGTGQVLDYDLGMYTLCPNCINGIVYVTRNVQRKKNVSFTGSSNACTLCRTTYCPGYSGKKEYNERCQNSSCGHTWQQHEW